MNDVSAAERYVAGRMNDSEIAEFEAQMLERPELAADVSVRHRIKAGLELLEGRGELRAIVAGVPRRTPFMRYAMAASVMAALIATGLVFLQRPSSDLLVAANELGTGVEPAFHRLARARGQSRDVVVVGPATRYIELRAVVDRPAGTMYEIRLRRLDGGASRELGVSDAAAADGEVATYLHAEHLPAGRYELSVTPRAGGEAHTLEFEVDRRP